MELALVERDRDSGKPCCAAEAAIICQHDPSESGCWDNSWCLRHRFWRREERLFRMTHLSGETSGSERDLGSPDDLLPDSYPEEVTLRVRPSSS